MDFMKRDIESVVRGLGYDDVVVKIDLETRWTTNSISAKGKKQLKEFGLSPPPRFKGSITIKDIENAVCPNCGSKNTALNSPFGPTLCRAIHLCKDCNEAFEQFKPLG